MSELQHKQDFRRWVDVQTSTQRKYKLEKKMYKSDTKEELTHNMIHKIEDILKEKGVKPMRTTFAGIKRPWKK